MNIWFVNRYAAHPQQAGGIRHYALARELKRRGHDTLVISADFDHVTQRVSRLSEGQRSKLEAIEGVDFLWMRVPRYKGNSLTRVHSMSVFALRTYTEVRRHSLADPDIIVGSTPDHFSAFASLQLARRLGATFLLEVRDLWPMTLTELGGMSPSHPFVLLLAQMEQYLYRQSPRIISLLPHATDHYVAKGAAPDNIVWIPNGIDLHFVPAPTPPPADGVFRVVFAGGHNVSNDLDTLLDAAALLQQSQMEQPCEFLFVGDGPEKARIQERAHREGLTIVRFVDALPKKPFYAALQQADVFIATTRPSDLYQHGVSFRKIYDYLALARPIVFGSASSNNPVLEAGAGLSVPPSSPRALSDAVLAIAHMSAAERWNLGMQGRQYIETGHSYELLAARLESVLLELQPRGANRPVRAQGAEHL